MAKTVVGLFDNTNEAQTVVQELVNAGFNREDISLAANDVHGAGANRVSGTHRGRMPVTAPAKDAGRARPWRRRRPAGGPGRAGHPGHRPHHRPPARWRPSLGPAAGATVRRGHRRGRGRLIGGLTHMGVPREQAEYYDEGVRRGGTLVTVSSPDDMVDRAVDIMNGNGAVDIDERADYYRQSGYTGYNETAPPYTTDQITRERDQYRTQPAMAASTQTGTVGTAQTNTAGTAMNQGEAVIPIVEEELAVGKRQVQRGGARIHTVVTERPSRSR